MSEKQVDVNRSELYGGTFPALRWDHTTPPDASDFVGDRNQKREALGRFPDDFLYAINLGGELYGLYCGVCECWLKLNPYESTQDFIGRHVRSDRHRGMRAFGEGCPGGAWGDVGPPPRRGPWRGHFTEHLIGYFWKKKKGKK
jgi:hypothetical protein